MHSLFYCKSLEEQLAQSSHSYSHSHMSGSVTDGSELLALSLLSFSRGYFTIRFSCFCASVLLKSWEYGFIIQCSQRDSYFQNSFDKKKKKKASCPILRSNGYFYPTTVSYSFWLYLCRTVTIPSPSHMSDEAQKEQLMFKRGHDLSFVLCLGRIIFCTCAMKDLPRKESFPMCVLILFKPAPQLTIVSGQTELYFVKKIISFLRNFPSFFCCWQTSLSN